MISTRFALSLLEVWISYDRLMKYNKHNDLTNSQRLHPIILDEFFMLSQPISKPGFTSHLLFLYSLARISKKSSGLAKIFVIQVSSPCIPGPHLVPSKFAISNLKFPLASTAANRRNAGTFPGNIQISPWILGREELLRKGCEVSTIMRSAMNACY
jgi:hypothetical protein